jgi:hypothetical protein
MVDSLSTEMFEKRMKTHGGSMAETVRSPRIARLSWGRLEVEGHGPFKDAKLFPGGAEEWDWGETGTSHTLGIQPADVDDLLSRGATVVVLSLGMKERLQVSLEALDLLKARGVAAHVLPTVEAVQAYNDLAEKEKVGGLFHSTC